MQRIIRCWLVGGSGAVDDAGIGSARDPRVRTRVHTRAPSEKQCYTTGIARANESHDYTLEWVSKVVRVITTFQSTHG